jgi:hypothetical protein
MDIGLNIVDKDPIGASFEYESGVSTVLIQLDLLNWFCGESRPLKGCTCFRRSRVPLHTLDRISLALVTLAGLVEDPCTSMHHYQP